MFHLVRPSVYLSVHNSLGVSSSCNNNWLLQKFLFLYFRTLYIVCLNIEDMDHLFCAHFINVFSSFGGVELGHFFIRNA